jgi:hypothetical protein
MREMQNPKSRKNPELAPARHRTPISYPRPETGAAVPLGRLVTFDGTHDLLIFGRHVEIEGRYTLAVHEPTGEVGVLIGKSQK